MSKKIEELNCPEEKIKQIYENVVKTIEPEIYQPYNNHEKIQQNYNHNELEEKTENKIRELKKSTNEISTNKKEKYIEDKLLEKYSRDLRNEIYIDEYKKIYNNIKNEISYKIREELLLKKQKEIEMKKKKYEYNNSKKLEEYQSNLYRNLKEEYEMSKIDIINIKINEFEEKYLKEFLNCKDKLKRELILEYQKMTNKLIEELEESKRDLVSQQNKEKNRIKQLNKIKGNYEEQEDYEKQRNEQINTMINNYKHFKMDNRRMNVYPSSNKCDILKNKKRRERSNKNQINKDISLNDEEKENKFILEKNLNKNGINIKEINNRIKKKNYI